MLSREIRWSVISIPPVGTSRSNSAMVDDLKLTEPPGTVTLTSAVLDVAAAVAGLG
jgi:hypothetical protein